MSEPRSRLDVGAFTAAEIQTMSRFVDISVDKVRRLTECAVLVGRLGRAVQDDGLPSVEELAEALHSAELGCWGPEATVMGEVDSTGSNIVGCNLRWNGTTPSLHDDQAERILTALRGAAPPLHDPQEPADAD